MVGHLDASLHRDAAGEYGVSAQSEITNDFFSDDRVFA